METKKFRLFRLINEKLFWPFSLPAKIEETETNSEGKKQFKNMLNEKGNVAVYVYTASTITTFANESDFLNEGNVICLIYLDLIKASFRDIRGNY